MGRGPVSSGLLSGRLLFVFRRGVGPLRSGSSTVRVSVARTFVRSESRLKHE